MALAASLFLFAGGCNNDSEKKNVSDDDAKKTVSEYSPGAVITECDYDDNLSAYEIKFETDYGEYKAVVSGESGKLISVTLIEEDPVIPEEKPDDHDAKKQALTPDDALTVAIMDADVSGSVMTVKNSYNSEDNTYYIIFRSGNKEFTYEIDAETGDIVDSSVDMDS